MSTSAVTADRIIFKPERTNHLPYILKEWFVSLCLVGALLVLVWLVKDNISKTSALVAVLAMMSLTISREILAFRLLFIAFDPAGRNLEIQYKSLFGVVREKKISFDYANLEVIKGKPLFKSEAVIRTVYLLKSKVEIYELKKNKDGFSVGALEQIVSMAEQLSLSVKQV